MATKYLEWFEQPLMKWRNNQQTPLFDCQYQEHDSQRQKCYDAESCFLNILENKSIENERIEQIDDIQKYIDKICTYVWFKRRWKLNHKINVLDVRHNSKAKGNWGSGWIKIPLWARSKVIILHELAHAITPYSTGGAHGRYWVRTFLELIKFQFGETEMKILRDCFKRQNVKYNPKRILSPESKEAARIRFIENVLEKK